MQRSTQRSMQRSMRRLPRRAPVPSGAAPARRLRQLAVGLTLAAGTTVSLPAQRSSDCASLPDLTWQDGCRKSQDLFAYMAPQLGTAMAGGNATPGQGGALGGPGHFALGVRGNVVAGSFPLVDEVPLSATGARADTYRTEERYLPFPAVDLAVGVFPGIDVGATRIGGIDALVSAYYATDHESDAVRLTVSGSRLRLGFGARVGVIQETLALPGVSVSWLRRDLPTLDLAGMAPPALGAGAEDTLGVEDLSMRTTALRVVAGKGFGILGIVVGAGRDRYEADAVLRGARGAQSVEAASFAFDMTRTTMFADLSLHLGLLRIVGEVGRVSGGDVETFNRFSGSPADDARLYGSVGLRFGR